MLVMAILAVMVPAVVAAALRGIGRGRWWGASAVGLAYIAGQVVIARPAIPPVEVTDRIPWLALAATALAVFETARKPGAIGNGIGRAVLAVLTIGLILGPVVTAGEISRPTLTWLLASTAVALIAWLDLEALAARPRGAEVVRTLIITAGGAGVVLLLSGSMILGFLGVALTAALAGSWLGAWGRAPEGDAPVAFAVLTALVLDGYVYAALSIPSALLLATAPAASWVTRIGPARRLGPWTAAALGTVTTLIPVGIAVGLAVADSLNSEY